MKLLLEKTFQKGSPTGIFSPNCLQKKQRNTICSLQEASSMTGACMTANMSWLGRCPSIYSFSTDYLQPSKQLNSHSSKGVVPEESIYRYNTLFLFFFDSLHLLIDSMNIWQYSHFLPNTFGICFTFCRQCTIMNIFTELIR